MSESAARKWLIISALSVFGIWWYRQWREGPQKALGAPLDSAKFVTAWGTVFFVLSLITEANPAFGGSFSILVMVGDLLGNVLPPKGSKTGGLLQDLAGARAGTPAAGSVSLLSPAVTPAVTSVTAPVSPVVGPGTVRIPSPGAGTSGAAAVGEGAAR